MALVLLIDDEQPNVDFMRALLRTEGHELIWAADGVQGLALIRQRRPKLVLCDVVMPHLGGYAVLETVRADPQISSVPIILFSAVMTEDARSIGLRRGATEVLARPFDVEKLRAAIRHCLGEEGK